MINRRAVGDSGKLEVYDTTLRDGAQSEDISFTVDDKLAVTLILDNLGVHFIEGGWPGANPKDIEYFDRVRNLKLANAKIVAFGSTHNPKNSAEDDINLKALVAAGTEYVTIFGKTWDHHVINALGITLERNLEIIGDSILFLRKNGKRVFFDAEHFFDGSKKNSSYATACLKQAELAGAERIILCDTNGGCLPSDVGDEIALCKNLISVPLGIHAHNDSGCAVASSMEAVDLGAVQVQGTINGFGERCGNADLLTLIPNLQLKMEYECIPPEKMSSLKTVCRQINEIANLRNFKHQPFVGGSAFAHKGGIHVSAVERDPTTYEHVPPESVGNERRFLVSDMSGGATVLNKAKQFDIVLAPKSDELKSVVAEIKKREHQGYQYESADASLELLMREHVTGYIRPFKLIKLKVVNCQELGKLPHNEATVYVEILGQVEKATLKSYEGPVDAVNKALRKLLVKRFAYLKSVKLTDYHVRVLNGAGTNTKVLVHCDWTDGKKTWKTIGVSKDIIKASSEASFDSYAYKILIG